MTGLPVTLGLPTEPDPDLLARLLAGISTAGRWSNGGPVVEQLEQTLAHDLGSRFALAASSGTSALTVALLALDLPPGGEVITTPLTFPATAQAIELAGLVPVFAGVDSRTLNLDPGAVREAIGPRTVAILPVHLFGVAADPRLDVIAAEAGLPIVFDAAHAYGLDGVAARGTAAAYSLHATKLLHSGEGGLITTSDATVAAKAGRARNFGLRGDTVEGRGTNAKLSEIAAAVGLAVRAGLENEIARREAVRERYAQIVADSDRVQQHAPGEPRALVMEVVRCEPEDQGRLLDDLAARGVLGRRFPALTSEGRFGSSGFRLVGGDRLEVQRLAASRIALPIHGKVTAAALDAVSDAVGSPRT